MTNSFGCCIRFYLLLVLVALLAAEVVGISIAAPRPLMMHVSSSSRKSDELKIVAAMLPGDPIVTGTIAQGVINGISIFSNVILAR